MKRPRAAMQPSGDRRPRLANTLPMTLRVYRKLSFAMVPLAPAVIKRRLKLGKEDPERVSERRGMSADIRPSGPLVWIHGASVGEVLAAAALIEKLRALNLRILVTSGTVTSAAIVAKRFPPDVIHQYVPYDSPRYVARFLDHWRPSLALFIESDLWPNLILSSAAAADGPDQRTDVASFVPALAPGLRHHLGAARPIRHLPRAIAGRCGTLFRIGQPQRPDHGKPQARRSRAARRPREAGEADGGDARPPDRARSLHASRRRGTAGRCAPDAGRILSAVVDRDRAAASRSRRAGCPHDRRHRPERGAAFARGIADGGHRYLRRRHHGRIGFVLPAGADRVHGRIAGRAWRTKSDRGRQARCVDRAWPACLQFYRCV